MREEWIGRWAKKTIVCIASGPSLVAEDCALVKESGHPTIVTNTTFKLCPWADVLMAFDSKWWRQYGSEAKAEFKGKLLTCSQGAGYAGIPTMHGQAWFRSFGNSGTASIALAVFAGAAKVILLGYDCQKTGGKSHWHGDHPPMLSNAGSMGEWPRKFANVARFSREQGVEVLNASRETALTCFPLVSLEDVV